MSSGLLLLTLKVGHLLCDAGHSCTIQPPLAAPVLSRSLKLPLMLLFMLLLFCALDFLADDVLECLTLMDYFKAIINVLKTKFWKKNGSHKLITVRIFPSVFVKFMLFALQTKMQA